MLWLDRVGSCLSKLLPNDSELMIPLKLDMMNKLAEDSKAQVKLSLNLRQRARNSVLDVTSLVAGDLLRVEHPRSYLYKFVKL